MNPSSLYQRVGAVALIRFQSGRVNSLSLSLRQWLSHALTVAQGDEAVRAIVLMGEGGVFSAGADVTEFNTPAASTEPTLPSVIEQVAKSAKPVVAAIDGVAYGGGLELALACQQRLLSSRAKLALPEVTLGLVPGAGGTQRLPRVVGLSCALDMVSTGRPVAAEEAVAIGLGEGLSDEDLAAAACAYAQGLALVPVLSDAPALPLGTDEEALLQQAYARVAKTQRGFMAPKVAIDCVAASTRLGLNAGLAYERQQFDRLVQGQETQALRHLFFAQRQAAKTAVTEPLPPIRTIAVVGGGLMGTGISINAADAGLPVLLLEQDAEALAKALARIKAHYQRQVAQGRLAQAAATAKTALIVGTLVEQEVAEVDLVIEAVFEDMTLKQSVLARLDAVCGPDTLIASNTSRLDINLLASSTQRPQQVLGMHFFSPANVMRLLEVVRGSETAPVTVARVMALAKRLNKVAVVVGVCEGFVGNRMLSPYQREALFLLEEGASVAQVDGALYGFGMAMGPFVMSDMAGLDIGWAARKRLAPTRDPRRRYSHVADRLCEQGRFGQKTLAGYYRYASGSRTPIPDEAVAQVVQDCAQAAGIVQKPISDATILARTLYALINEAAKIIGEGIATAGDVDLVYVHGYGFPAYRGGPLFYADSLGLDKVLAQIQAFYVAHGEDWRPAPLLMQLVAAGQGFYGPLRAS